MWTVIRNNLKAGLIGLTSLTLAAPVGAAVLQPFTATYSASHGFIGLGEATFQLERANGCWHWHGVANPSGIAALFVGQVTDSSHFCVAEDGTLLPQHFQHHEEGAPEDSYSLSFNWNKGTVQYNGGEPSEVKRGTVDPFLIQILARLWLARSDQPTGMTPRQFTVVDEDEITHYRLAASDGKRITTKAGTFDTIKIARIDEDDEQLIFWTAPELDYMPVKVAHRENGETQIALLLTSFEQRPVPDSVKTPEKASKSKQN